MDLATVFLVGEGLHSLANDLLPFQLKTIYEPHIWGRGPIWTLQSVHSEQNRKNQTKNISKSFWGSKGSFFKKTPWSPKAFISMILSCNDLLKLCDIHNEHAVAAQSAFDDVDGVHDGRVVAIEHAADVGEGHVGQIAE